MSLKVLCLSLAAMLMSACHAVAQEPQHSSNAPNAQIVVAATAKLLLTTESETPKPAAPLTAEALDQLMTALQAAQETKSFRAQLNSQIDGEEADTLALEVVAPDRRRIKGHNLEIIVVGADGYLSFGSKWQKALRDPESKSSVFKVAHAPIFWGKDENEAARSFITMKSATPTTYEEQAATLYEYEMKDAFGKTGLCALRTWVTQADGLPRKTEMQGAYEGRQAKAVLAWLEYNAALAIETPVLP